LVELIKEHEEKKGYKLLTYHLEVFGLCPECKKEV